MPSSCTYIHTTGQSGKSRDHENPRHSMTLRQKKIIISVLANPSFEKLGSGQCIYVKQGPKRKAAWYETSRPCHVLDNARLRQRRASSSFNVGMGNDERKSRVAGFDLWDIGQSCCCPCATCLNVTRAAFPENLLPHIYGLLSSDWTKIHLVRIFFLLCV